MFLPDERKQPNDADEREKIRMQRSNREYRIERE